MALKSPLIKLPELTYAVAELFPPQGEWTEAEYVALDTNRIVELSDGCLEVADMPNDLHQLILQRLFLAVVLFVNAHRLGQVRFAPLRVRLWRGKFREPDLVFMSAAHERRLGNDYWGVPDLVAKVLSPSNPDLDRIKKKGEYARAGIPEYWIVDAEAKTVEVYRLRAKRYQLVHKLAEGDRLTSKQLPGFEFKMAELFAE